MRWPKINTPLPGPRAREVLALDHAHMSPSLTRLYPFVADHGEGCWICDVDGNLFLDFTSGIAVNTVGYGHSKVIAAVEHQLPRLVHFSVADFHHPLAAQLVAELARLFPGAGPHAPSKVFLCNSGAEAVEGAMKLARYHTGRTKFVAFRGAFHGRTLGALSLSDSKPIHKKGFGPLLDGVTHISYSLAGLEHLEKELFTTSLPPEEVAAVFVEPIQGEAGVVVPEPEFLPALFRLCNRHGILLVSDEVQTGMGRTGKMFACEHWAVIPDIICVAKGIASGLPLGAVMARSEVMDWPSGTHTSTFGGNPLACAAALATIEIIKGGLLVHVRVMSDLLFRGLQQIAAKGLHIGTVRGMGLLAGIVIEDANGNAERAQGERDKILRLAFEHGLLLLAGGQSVVRMCPPLIVNSEEIEVGLEIFEMALKEVTRVKVLV